ncbi:MAG: stress response translation initiation inhibitor YciH [Thermotogota bacterium]
MVELDPITGLPKELGVWEDIAKEDQLITVEIVRKKYGKKYTVVKGISNKDVNAKEITTKLKSKFACGGTLKDGAIELQGDYLSKMRDVLVNLGFPAESIEIKK